MKSWFLKVTVLLTLAALVLTACGSPAATTQAPAEPTSAPAATQAPAQPTTPPEPTATAKSPSEASTSGADWKNTDAYSPMTEKVTVTLVKGGQENAATLPAGETIEDNRDLKYIEDTLNIDIQFSWIVPSDSYADKLNLAITSGEIPDVMIVTPIQLQQLAEADALEDLSNIVEKYASPAVM